MVNLAFWKMSLYMWLEILHNTTCMYLQCKWSWSVLVPFFSLQQLLEVGGLFNEGAWERCKWPWWILCSSVIQGEMDILGQWFNYRSRSFGCHSLLSIRLCKLYLLTKRWKCKSISRFTCNVIVLSRCGSECRR